MSNNQGNNRRLQSRLLVKPIRYALDVAVLMSAFLLSYMLRFDFNIPNEELAHALVQLPYVVLIQVALLRLAGVYSFIWRYIGMGEIKAFCAGASLSFLPIVVLRLGLPDSLHRWRVPLSIATVDTILAFGGVLAVRVLRRVVYERYEKRQKTTLGMSAPRKPVLLIGAGRAGVLAAKEILGRGDMDLLIKGFVDDEPNKKNSVIHGIKVLGATSDLPRLAQELGIDHVVITIAETSGLEIQRIVKICERIPIRVRIIPGLYELLQGKVEITRIRDVQIADLLGRDPVHIDERDRQRFLEGKVVMVTGAGGSIGSELVRQVARFKPATLLLVERAEFVLFEVDREVRGIWPDLPVIPLVADVGDKTRMNSIFATHKPQVILHAAAHKHVPMMEYNSAEAIKNNVLASRLLGELAGKHKVETFVLISTDKAVRPTSVMGASKRVAELVMQSLNARFKTKYVAVRFGNVIGSAGSVVPIFNQQIRSGGPVTVTHEEMKRYFMTIPEAAQLVLQASAMGEGGEIFILDMGEPVRILDLAKTAITLSGLTAFEDIDIVITGVRPGEKLFEELEIKEECMSKTLHPKIFIGKIAVYSEEKVQQALERLTFLSAGEREGELRAYLNELLPEATIEVLDAEAVRAFALSNSGK